MHLFTLFGSFVRHEGMSYVCGVIDSQSDCENEVDGRHRVDRYAPEVDETHDVNLNDPIIRKNCIKTREVDSSTAIRLQMMLTYW